jgi:hypothetical protein
VALGQPLPSSPGSTYAEAESGLEASASPRLIIFGQILLSARLRPSAPGFRIAAFAAGRMPARNAPRLNATHLPPTLASLLRRARLRSITIPHVCISIAEAASEHGQKQRP